MATGSSDSNSISESSSAFSRNLFSQILLTKKNDNIVISPASVQTCVALAYFGAKGTTEIEMAKGLQFGKTEKDIIAKRYENLSKSSINSAILNIANKIYVNHELHIKSQFNKIANNAFKTNAEQINFKNNNEAIDKINKWVENQTKNTIKNLLDSIDPETAMILINAIHLKAEWQYKFDKLSTHKSDFWLTTNKSIQVDTMSNTDKYEYSEWSDLDAIAVSMPYKNSDLSMVIVLPKERNGLEALEKKLINIDILKLANKMTIHDVNIVLPKFKIESNFKLNDALKNLGMSTMFSDAADFSDLFDDKTPVRVSEVIHKAFINVDEDGTEASAATIMKMVPMSLNPDEKHVQVDHPFLYFIKNQDYIYFMGHITKL